MRRGADDLRTRGIHNSIAGFAGWADGSGAQLLAGDFDGDGDADLALVGGSGWTTIPVAFSQRDGNFLVSNRSHAQFAGWASGGPKAIAGDFDGDGDADIALVGGPGWITSAFALSDRTGSFASANFPMRDFPAWAGGARAAVGR